MLLKHCISGEQNLKFGFWISWFCTMRIKYTIHHRTVLIMTRNSVTAVLDIRHRSTLYKACVHAKLIQWCSALWNPMDCSLPGFSVCGILQARILEWLAMPFSRVSSWPRDWTHISWGSCIAGRFFTAEPLRKPTLYYITVLFFHFLIDTTSPIIFSDYHSKKFELPKCLLFSFLKFYLFILIGG